MDLFNLEELGLDMQLIPAASCPSRGITTHASTAIPNGTNTSMSSSSSTAMLWAIPHSFSPESPYTNAISPTPTPTEVDIPSQFFNSSISSALLISPPAAAPAPIPRRKPPFAIPPLQSYQTQYQQPTPTPTSPNPVHQPHTQNACLRSILILTSQLDHFPPPAQNQHTNPASGATGSDSSFNLTLSRAIVQACERYTACSSCDESLTTILYAVALRRAALSYRQLALCLFPPSSSPGHPSPPSAASLPAPPFLGSPPAPPYGPPIAASLGAGHGCAFRCHIGTFETNIVLDEETWRCVLRAEVQRAEKSAVGMRRLLGEGSAKKRPTDEFTAQYHAKVISGALGELRGTLGLLGGGDGG